MTVCIAAACFEGDDPRIVVCKDWRGEVEGVGSSDDVQKLRRLSPNWIALIANNLNRAEELCLRYEYSLKTNPLTEQNFAGELRRIFCEHKKAMADSFLRIKYGFSLDQLVNQGKGAFGESFVSGCFEDISRLTTQADLIVAGFVEAYDYEDKTSVAEPMICSISEANEGDPVVLEEEFAVIGSGGSVARSMMLSREQSSRDSLMQTVYSVYEAKLMSETVPGVGPSFSIEVLHPNGSLRSLSDEGVKRCEALFRRFGPRTIAVKKREEWFKLEEAYFEVFE